MMSIIDSQRAHAFQKNLLGLWVVSSRALTHTERQSLWDGFVLWALSTADLLDDCGVDSSPFLKYMRSYFHHSGEIVDLMRLLKKACEKWRQCENPDVFHEFCSEFLGLEPISVLVPAVVDFSITRSVATFKLIHHWLAFLTKMPISAPFLEQAAIDDYLASERRLNDLSINPDIFESMRTILSEWFVDFIVDSLPDHGPGSTADAGSALDDKMAHLGWDELFLMCPEFNELFGTDANRPFSRTSKVVLVPKTALSLRTISEEPATLQYWQKPVLQAFTQVFKKSDLRFHVSLEDQSLNGDMAIMASQTGDYSTLDLKAASDSVSLQLVERIFPWNVLRYLVATRSTHTTLPDGTVLPLLKFAPMGSSVCFPLECTIFSCLCELVARDHRLSTHERKDAYRVYGDDIIIRNDLVYDLMLVLNATGFLINESKSFTTNSFRESCGIFAYKGEDITTPMLPRDHEALYASLHPSGYLRRIDLCNRFLLAGMSSARLYVLYSLPKETPFVQFQCEFLHFKTEHKRDLYSQYGIWTFEPPSNYKLSTKKADFSPLPAKVASQRPIQLTLPGPVKRIGPNYQRCKKKYLTPVVDGYRSKYSDVVRYDWWLRHAIAGRGTLDVIQAPFGSKPRSRMRLSWHS